MSPTSYQTAPPREIIITTTPNNGQTDSPHIRDAVDPAFPIQTIATDVLALSAGTPTSLLQLVALARGNDFRRIDGCSVDLFFENGPIFSDQEIHSPRGFVFIHEDAIFASDFAAPVAGQGKRHAYLIGKCFIRERTIHAHTHDLGVGCFQLLQVLLEVFHLLRSTTGEVKN